MIYFNGKRHGHAAVNILDDDSAYDKGYQEGYNAGHNIGMRDGYETAEFDFWHTYQQNGNRTNYTYAFYGPGWTDDLYEPMYPIKPTACNTMFQGSYITDTKVDIDLTAVGSNNQCFSYAQRLVTIRKVIFAAETKVDKNCFVYCTRLENITVEGEIGCNLSFADSPLTHDSLMSIINHLATVSTTKTLTLGTTNLAKLTDAEKAIATDKGWTLA